MTVRHSPNTPVTDYKLEALLYYHWLVFCNQFTEVQTSGVWSTLLSGTDGIIQAINPSVFQTVSSIFTAGHVGMYLAVKDETNPINNTISRITIFNSSTSVTLNSPVTAFSTNATGVSFKIIDPATLPSLGNYFVVENPVVLNQPSWQARFAVGATTTDIQFAPIGGWNPTTFSWTLPTCTQVSMPATLVQSFMVCDPDAGWVFLWTEETGGMGSNRNGIWLGSLSPFHSPRIAGAPSDESFAAIFGNRSGSAGTFSRSTASNSTLATGETLNHDNSIVPIYWVQKRLLGSGTDTNTISTANPNPRSTESDDYDMVAFQRTPEKAFRGRVPGVRLLNESLPNRTTISSGGTYVIASGIGVSWNGKATV